MSNNIANSNIKDKKQCYVEKLSEAVVTSLNNFSALSIGPVSEMEVDGSMSTNDKLLALVKSKFFLNLFL